MKQSITKYNIKLFPTVFVLFISAPITYRLKLAPSLNPFSS